MFGWYGTATAAAVAAPTGESFILFTSVDLFGVEIVDATSDFNFAQMRRLMFKYFYFTRVSQHRIWNT